MRFITSGFELEKFGGERKKLAECIVKDTRNERNKWVYAYDPIIKRTVPYLVFDNWVISAVTGYKFNYKNIKMRKGDYDDME